VTKSVPKLDILHEVLGGEACMLQVYVPNPRSVLHTLNE